MIHGGDIVSFKDVYPDREFHDFSANINPLGMPSAVKAAIAGSADAAAHYPDPKYRRLKRALSAYEGVATEKLVCGNGAADIIFKIAAQGFKSALILAPTFAEYELALRQHGTEVDYYDLAEENGFTLDAGILPRLLGKELVVLCNPNNPTGSVIEPALMAKIYQHCEATGTLLVVDECFMGFLFDGDHYSLTAKISHSRQLIILKAFTKTFAIPGVRLGYALVSDEGLARRLEETGQPWNVSVVAELAGIAATGSQEHVIKTREIISLQRQYLTRELKTLGLRVYPSKTNYLLFYSGDHRLGEKLWHRGFIIRDCSNYRGLSKGYFRIAVRLFEENKRLVNDIKETLNG